MALLTGRYPSDQACWTNSDVLASDIPTYVHGLGAAGYHPTLVGRLHAIGPDQEHGYAERRIGDHSTKWVGAKQHNLGVLEGTAEPFRVSIEKSGFGQSSYEALDRDVTKATLDLFDEIAEARQRGDDRPFAVSVGLMLPHAPYVCSRSDFELYEGKVDLPKLGRSYPEHPYFSKWRDHANIESLAAEDIVRARTSYYGLVTSMDRMVGQTLDKLNSSGLSDNTLIIYSSDHGDQLGDRDLWWKQSFYDDAAKVPLIMSWPSRFPEGERRNQVVNLIDVGATLLDAAGAKPPPGTRAKSLLKLAEDPSLPWINETYSEFCSDGMARWMPDDPVMQRMVRASRWKLIFSNEGRSQLFDLIDDPDELHDLAETKQFDAVREALSARVLAGWDPNRIAVQMARRRKDKEAFQSWARAVNPADSLRWQVKVEDNWLDTTSAHRGGANAS